MSIDTAIQRSDLAPAATPRRGIPVRPRRRLKGRTAPLALLALPVAVIGVTLGYPLFRQVVMSLQKYGLAQQFGKPPEWVGLNNYIAIVSDPYFWAVLARSLAFCLIVAAATMAVGIGMAVLMQRVSTYARIILTVCLMFVWAMPAIASLTVWQWILDARLGVLNYVLVHLGFTQFEGFSWLASSPLTFLAIVGVIVLWGSIPLVAITIYAALSQVSEEVLEAAGMDGAGFWARLRFIVLPIIKPIIFLIGVLQVIWDFRVFTQVYVLQQAGGVSKDTNVLGTYVYEIGVGQGEYGMASALAMVMLAIALLMTWFYMRSLARQGDI